MANIWFYIIWLCVVAGETLLYSILVKFMKGDYCEVTRIDAEWGSMLDCFDRFVEYQSWFIPMLILYWPSKSHKQENRCRTKAVRSLTPSSRLTDYH